MEPFVCSHPKCAVLIEGDVFFGRKSKLPYCSSVHRYLDGCRRRQSARRDPETERWYKIERKYGITKEQYDRIWKKQHGLCAICLAPLAFTKACTDHDHVSLDVRGILCNTCNQGIGYFAEDVDLLRRAIAYLLDAREGVSDVGD